MKFDNKEEHLMRDSYKKLKYFSKFVVILTILGTLCACDGDEGKKSVPKAMSGAGINAQNLIPSSINSWLYNSWLYKQPTSHKRQSVIAAKQTLMPKQKSRSSMAQKSISTLNTFNTLNQNSVISSKHSQKGSKHVWTRLRSNFEITHKHHQGREPSVQKFVKQYRSGRSLHQISNNAAPYMSYIVDRLEKRNLPGELALLPMIESNFKNHATSNRGAAGIWQFMPQTGRMFGLKQTAGYDGRRDVKASTEAALNYLESLHKEFNHDWMLALAAYNAGPGTVRKAIKINKRAGKPISFWDLKLPKQTQGYVPKFLALVEIFGNPDQHNLSLPKMMSNK